MNDTRGSGSPEGAAMCRALVRRIGCIAWLLAVLVALMPTAQATPADDQPTAVDPGRVGLDAALVRIQVIADVTIAHINHSTGDVVIDKGTYEVKQERVTGVLVSGDGVVATPYRLLRENLDKVAVPAANHLFVEEMDAELVDGNDAEGPTHATDPELDEHLQHCYRQVDHCVVVSHERFEVFLLTAGPQESVPATLVNEPTAPTDVALLRIGAQGLPSADLSPTHEPVEDAAVAGLVWPAAGSDPTRPSRTTLHQIRLDGAGLSPAGPLRKVLAGGLNGGPVIDQRTGGVLALADCDPATGAISAVGAASVQAALVTAEITPERSGFDTELTEGLELLNQEKYAAAVKRLQAATTYFDSPLAHQYLAMARERAGAQDGTGTGTGTGTPAPEAEGIPWWMSGVVVLLVLGALAAGLMIGRRRARPAGPTGGAASTKETPSASTEDAAR
jgi:hypothetical protein